MPGGRMPDPEDERFYGKTPIVIVSYGVTFVATSVLGLSLAIVFRSWWVLILPVVSFTWGVALIRGNLFAIRRARELALFLVVLAAWIGYKVAVVSGVRERALLEIALALVAGALFLIALPLWWKGREFERSLRELGEGSPGGQGGNNSSPEQP